MLHRFPDGTAGERIYQKRLPKGAPDWVETVEVRFPSGRTADELCVTELASVIWAVQMSTVEFHPWHSRRADTERPDELRIDLDPQPGTGFAEAKAVAGDRPRGARRARRGRLAEDVGLEGHPHLRADRAGRSGSARFAGRRSPSPARSSGGRPQLVTTAWWKEERGEQIFVDYNQNARDRTIASAYSVRASPLGLVSAPVTWDELPDVEMADFTIETMPARFAELGDLHEGIDDAVFSIEPLLEWAERDERDRGLGDAPYPPNFPKQEGEPPRVQPSRMNKANWTDAADAAPDLLDGVEPQRLD